jgi:hypothetical protein
VQVAANFTASPIEIVHRNGTTGAEMGREALPLTAVQVPTGLGPAPPEMR